MLYGVGSWVGVGGQTLGFLFLKSRRFFQEHTRVFAAGEVRLDLTPTKVNIDFPKWMVEALDVESDKFGVPRQSLMKLWLAERLEAAK